MTDYQNDDDEVEELNDSEAVGMSFLEHLESVFVGKKNLLPNY